MKPRVAAVLLLFFALVGCHREKPSRSIYIQAHRYAFDPAVIHLKKGELVELVITTSDVQHGFEVKDLGIRESIQKGKPATVRLRPERIGEFNVRCYVLCGRGHDGMTAKIIVE